MVIYLERGADLHTAQLMPLPLTVSCFSKIVTGFTNLHPGGPGQRAIKQVCVCVLHFDRGCVDGETVRHVGDAMLAEPSRARLQHCLSSRHRHRTADCMASHSFSTVLHS